MFALPVFYKSYIVIMFQTGAKKVDWAARKIQPKWWKKRNACFDYFEHRLEISTPESLILYCELVTVLTY